jgi:hypothetical protein
MYFIMYKCHLRRRNIGLGVYKRLKGVTFIYSVFFGWVHELWNHSIRTKTVIGSLLFSFTTLLIEKHSIRSD